MTRPISKAGVVTELASQMYPPNHVRVTMNAVRNPVDAVLMGGEVGDTISVIGVDGTSASIPDWFSYDPTVDDSYGYGIRFNEEGVYSGMLYVTASLANADVGSVFLELISKDTGNETDFGMFNTSHGLKMCSQGVVLHAANQPIPTSLLVGNTSMVATDEYHGFYALWWTPVESDSPSVSVTFKLDLSLSRIA